MRSGVYRNILQKAGRQSVKKITAHHWKGELGVKVEQQSNNIE